MKKENEMIALGQLQSAADPLSEIVQAGAHRMLAVALQAEVKVFVTEYAEEMLPDGRQRVVRQGYGPERSIRHLNRRAGNAASESA